MFSICLYLLFGIGLVTTNLMHLSEEDEARYQVLKKETPGALIFGLAVSILFWAPILFYGLIFAAKKEE